MAVSDEELSLEASLATHVGTKQAIETIALGSRVRSESPRPSEYDRTLAEPTEATRHQWREITFDVHHDDGRHVVVELLRPVAWLLEHGIQDDVVVVLPESEIGPAVSARVRSIRHCPPIMDVAGVGEANRTTVVTGRFTTVQVKGLLQLTVAGGSRIDVTPDHLIWSEWRRDWIPAANLAVGEPLKTENGQTVCIEAIAHRNMAQPVFNLETHGHHTYFAGTAGVLVHNVCFRGDVALEIPEQNLRHYV